MMRMSGRVCPTWMHTYFSHYATPFPFFPSTTSIYILSHSLALHFTAHLSFCHLQFGYSFQSSKSFIRILSSRTAEEISFLLVFRVIHVSNPLYSNQPNCCSSYFIGLQYLSALSPIFAVCVWLCSTIILRAMYLCLCHEYVVSLLHDQLQLMG